MVRRKRTFLRRCGILALGACSALFSTGCIRAAGDAAGAGVLNFIQDGVLSVLSSVLLGAGAASDMEEMGMDESLMSDDAHDGHAG